MYKHMHEHREARESLSLSLAPFGQSASRTHSARNNAPDVALPSGRGKRRRCQSMFAPSDPTPWNSIAETLRHKGFLFGLTFALVSVVLRDFVNIYYLAYFNSFLYTYILERINIFIR